MQRGRLPLRGIQSIGAHGRSGHERILPIRTRTVIKFLKELNGEKATGADGLSAKVLKECASELGLPVAKLFRRILNSGCWPSVEQALDCAAVQEEVSVGPRELPGGAPDAAAF